MGKNTQPPKPTAAELAILSVLWRNGPSTVRQVMEALNEEKPTGYSTALKLMQIMSEKGLVKRDENQQTHVYRPAIPAERTRAQIVADLMERAFDGSAQRLIMQALTAKKASKEELDELRAMLDKLASEHK